jgi:hypothetical protein
MVVNKNIIECRLQVNTSAKPKKQKLYKMSDDKVATVKSEVERLLDARFICEVQYPRWLVNVVMVKKNGKWRMCTYFSDLNNCCPRDDFLLSRIDKVVGSVAGCETISLLDCFYVYYQIWPRKEDEEKANFMTPFGTYCYLRIFEGLKKADPTICRMMKAILKDQM